MSFHVPSDVMDGAFMALRKKRNATDSNASVSSNHSEESQSSNSSQSNSDSKSSASNAIQKHGEDEEYRVANSTNAHDDAKLGIDNGNSQSNTSQQSQSDNTSDKVNTRATNTNTDNDNNTDTNTNTNNNNGFHHMTKKEAQSPSKAKDMAPQIAANNTKSLMAADKAGRNYSDSKDYHPQKFIDSGYTNLMRTIVTVNEAHENHNLSDESAKKITKCLATFAKQWRRALEILWSVHNDSIERLQSKISSLESAKNGLKGVNVPHQLGIILQWARTGVPAKLDADFRRIDAIAHDPQFQAWAKDNKANKGLGIPQPLMSRYAKAHQQRAERIAKQSSAANSKNGN